MTTKIASTGSEALVGGREVGAAHGTPAPKLAENVSGLKTSRSMSSPKVKVTRAT